MKRTKKTTKEDINALHEKLVQTCIDFVNEHNLSDLWRVEFNADELQESADAGKWMPATDSYLRVEGVKIETVMAGDLKVPMPSSYLIGESI